jgi:hypothetical protein
VRNPTQGDFDWHHHAIAPGLPLDRYGSLVPAQMDDYRRHALGLKGRHDSGSDPQCRGGHTIVTFNYADWKDEHMPISDDQINDIATKAVNKLLDAPLSLSDGTTVPVSQALRRAAQAPANLDAAVATVLAEVKAKASNTNLKVTNSRTAIVNAINSAHSVEMAKLDELDDQVGP